MAQDAAQQADQPATTQQNAQGSAGADQQGNPPIIALADWSYDDIYSNGWSLENLIDEADVYGAEGEEIGDIENVLIGADGKILAIIAEVGGFLDIGDTHVSVPWNEVEFSPGLDYIKTPVNQENVEDYSVFGDWEFITKSDTETRQVVNDDLATGPRVWKATDLLNDYALLTGNLAYGYVDDLIFTNDGKLHAVIVDADASYGAGLRAFPYYGYAYGWTPFSPYYTLPYGADEVAVIDTFDPDRMSDNVKMSGTASATDEPAATGSVSSSDTDTSAEGTENSAN
jgi:hypothetical protein